MYQCWGLPHGLAQCTVSSFLPSFLPSFLAFCLLFSLRPFLTSFLHVPVLRPDSPAGPMHSPFFLSFLPFLLAFFLPSSLHPFFPSFLHASWAQCRVWDVRHMTDHRSDDPYYLARSPSSVNLSLLIIWWMKALNCHYCCQSGSYAMRSVIFVSFSLCAGLQKYGNQPI